MRVWIALVETHAGAENGDGNQSRHSTDKRGRIRLAGPANHLRSVALDGLDRDRLIWPQLDGGCDQVARFSAPGKRRPAAVDGTDFDPAPKNVRFGSPGPIHLNAELRPQIADQGGRSADREQDLPRWDWGFGIVHRGARGERSGWLPLGLRGGWVDGSLAPRLYSCGQLAERQEAAAGRFDPICCRALEDDLGPRVVGDFQQSRGQDVLAAQPGGSMQDRLALRIGPSTIDHACDQANRRRLRFLFR